MTKPDASNHPLELIPFFRRWPAGTARDLVYTFVVGLGFCLFFFGIYAYNVPSEHLGRQLWNDFVIAMAISYTCHGLYGLGDRFLGSWQRKLQGWRRVAYYMAVPVCGVFAGYYLGMVLLSPTGARRNIFTPGVVLSFAIVAVMVSCVLMFAYLMRERELLAKARLEAEKRRVVEAQLRMLQAQIEPHFLYNTLANAVALITPAPDNARLLLERLIDYLRATLAASRGAETTVRREVDTIKAYLDLMKLRMGERLRYRIEVPDAASSLPLPPMLLQPLVENAINHGLEPKIEGGEIVLAARIEASHLRVSVSDTGAGFQPDARRKPGGGVGLSNLRERIAALYGKDGSLTISEQAAGGVSVVLRIPLPHPAHAESAA